MKKIGLLLGRLINSVFLLGQGRDNFVLGSLITSSESLNESWRAITHGRGSCDTVMKYPWWREVCCIVGGTEWRKHVGRHIKIHKHAPAFVSFINSFSESICATNTHAHTHTHTHSRRVPVHDLL